MYLRKITFFSPVPTPTEAERYAISLHFAEHGESASGYSIAFYEGEDLRAVAARLREAAAAIEQRVQGDVPTFTMDGIIGKAELPRRYEP